MTREEKAAMIDSLAEDITVHAHFYVVNAMGMRVSETEAWRDLCRSRGLRYRVAKNSLIKKALARQKKEEAYAPLMGEVLENFSGLLFSSVEGAEGAKALVHFHRAQGVDYPRLKGAEVDGELYIGEAQLTALAARKSKEVLIGELVMLLQEPMRQILGAVNGGKVIGLLQAVADKKAK